MLPAGTPRLSTAASLYCELITEIQQSSSKLIAEELQSQAARS